MDTVTPEAVAEFVARLAPMYISDPVRVELLPFADGCPFRAAISWEPERGGWYVLGNRSDNPAELAERLFHELAHVFFGDIGKDGASKWASLQRQAAQGSLARPSQRGALAAECKATVATEAARAREQRATLWARERVADWWPCLRDWKDPAKAAAAAWWVHNELQKRR